MADNTSWRIGSERENGELTITVDGNPTQAMPGETLAAALYASGIRAWRRSRQGDPRGLLCGMGICYDCLVTIDGLPGQRACQVEVRPGMVVSTGHKGED